MKNALVRIVLGLAAASMSFHFANADDEALHSVHTLPCIDKCANSTGPTALEHSLPAYPDRNDPYYVEGFVTLQYRIDADGHVGDIALLQLVGPQEFADSTMRAVKGWTYTPATIEGKPVPVCHTLMMTFRYRTYQPGGRPEVSQAYREAINDLRDGKIDDAKTVLATALARPKLNFYERGMLANIAGMIALQKEDYIGARHTVEMVTSHGMGDLAPQIQHQLLDTRIRASLSMGDIVDAQEMLDRVRMVRGFKEDDPLIRLVQDAKSRIDSAPAFAMDGRIPDAADGVGFYFGLYHRAFGFKTLSGSLAKFTLSCRQQAVESDISDKAEWHVPKSWSDCRVLVRGAPGTTFRVVQET